MFIYQQNRRSAAGLPSAAADPSIAASSTSPSPSSAAAPRQVLAHDLVSNMSLSTKIGQMSQVDISQIVTKSDDGKILPNLDKIKYYFGDLAIGSILNCPNTDGPQWTASDYRRVVVAIRQVTDEYGLPPVIWGLDSVHGANYVNGAIVTPQQINLAATFNRTVAYQEGVMASKDTRAAGITWLFSPILGLALQPSWSRVYETFGEDPLVASVMGVQLIRGIQEPDEDEGVVPRRAAACAKHFVGYSMPRTGHDRSPAWIPRRHLYQYFVQPWREAIRDVGEDGRGGGVLTVMESYSETDGVPNVANFDSTRLLLREALGFDGVLVTDYHEILNLVDWHRIAADGYEAVKLMLRDSSVDMSMVPVDMEDFAKQVRAAVTGSSSEDRSNPPLPRKIDMSRIVESTERVVALKAHLRMFQERVTMDSPLIDTVGSDEDRALALDMAQQSIVLVENRDNTLPISSSSPVKVHVTGPTSNSLAYQSGGWTVDWQGSPSDSYFTYGTTVVQAAKNVPNWDVTTSCGVSILGEECKDEDGASPEAMKSADFVLIAIGEENYTEKPGDIRDLRLAQGQIDFVRTVKSETRAKLVVVYLGGRPRLLEDVADIADAIFIAFLPGPDGGQAVIDLITGAVNPSGRLPITYPKYPDGGGASYFSAVSDQCTVGEGPLPHWENRRCGAQWNFGNGLSYTTFEYSELTVSENVMLFIPGAADEGNSIKVSATVRNSGSLPGSDTVLFFLFDDTRYVTPEYKRLRYFEKLSLEPGEERQVTWDISMEDIYHIGPHDDTHLVLQEGMQFRVGMGPGTDCRASPDNALCSPPIQLQSFDGQHYVGACDAACRVWAGSGCSSHYGMDWDSCWTMCTDIAGENYEMHGRHEGWGWNYVECIESVSRNMKHEAGVAQDDDCWKMTAMCRDIFHTTLLDEYGNCSLDVEANVAVIGVIVAFVAGIIAASFTFAMVSKGGRLGWRRRKENNSNHVEFTPLPNKSNGEENKIT